MRLLRNLIATTILAFISFPFTAFGASLLPNGEQTFLGQNGEPLASGTVTFYIPNTTTPKTTWKNANQTIANTNPVILNGSGRAIIYGVGSYRQIVKDSLGNVIWDQITSDPTGVGSTSWGGTSSGSANAQIVVAPSFSSIDGQSISFIAGFTNSSAMTLNPGTGPINVLKDTASGPVSLTGGEVVAGNLIQVVYSSGTGAFHLVSFPQNSYANLSATNLTVTGTATLPTATTVGGTSVFVSGEIRTFAMNTCPTGWQEANGNAISRTTYAALFTNIGTTWGSGDGSTTFNVPDFRGYFLRGWSNGSSVDSGRTFASTQLDAFQNHTFNLSVADIVAGTQLGGSSVAFVVVSGTAGNPVANGAGAPRLGFETRPVNKAVLYCVKL